MYLFAQAAADADAGASFVGFLILMGILFAIYKACSKKKSYDVKLGGTIRER